MEDEVYPSALHKRFFSQATRQFQGTLPHAYSVSKKHALQSTMAAGNFCFLLISGSTSEIKTQSTFDFHGQLIGQQAKL